MEEVTTNPLYECPSGLHVTPRKWCGYIKRELNETLMENVIKRTNPGCVIKRVHPWFKSTARVECYSSNNGYVVGITEDDWVSVVPAAIRCPKDFDLVFPKYPSEEAIKGGDFTFPPLCLARKYLPRSISCPGVLLRKGLIVTDRYIVDTEINPTPFKQHIDVSHYSCQIQDRVKPSIVCPIINVESYLRIRSSLSNSEHDLSSHWSTMEAIKYQSGLSDFTSYSNLLNRNPSILSELEVTQREFSGNTSEDNNSSLSDDSADNSNAVDGDLRDTLKPVPFHKHNLYRMELHEYKHYYNDTIEKHLKSMNDYNNHEFSYYPFRLNTTLDNPWIATSSSHLRREGPGKKQASHSKEIRGRNPDKELHKYTAKDLKRGQPSKQGEYFNDYQWDFLSRFYRVYVSNQIDFVSNIPVSSISHKAQTVDGGYQLNINLDPTYQSFVSFTLEQMKHLDSELNITNIRDSLNKTRDGGNIDVPQLIYKLSAVNDIISRGNEPNITREHEYKAWERSARLYFMDLDLMKKNQILYSSVNSYKHRRRFPFLYYYSKQPSIHNDYGHVRRPAISDHKYRYGSPSEDYHKYTGRHESSDILYYMNRYLNQTKPYRHPPGPETPYKCISINETTPIIECPDSSITIPKCFILDIIHNKLTELYRMTHNSSTDNSNNETEPTASLTPEETDDNLEKEKEEEKKEEREEMNELIDSRPISIQEGLNEMGDLEVIGSLQGSGDILNELGYLGNLGGLENIEMLDNIEGFGGIEV